MQFVNIGNIRSLPKGGGKEVKIWEGKRQLYMGLVNFIKK